MGATMRDALQNHRSEFRSVGLGFSVQFELDSSGRLDARWLPRLPQAGREFNRTLARYRQRRDAFLQQVAEKSGLRVAVAEVTR